MIWQERESCVSRKPQLNEVPEDKAMMQVSDIFPSCAVTRAMARRNKELLPQSEDVGNTLQAHYSDTQ